MKLYFPCHISLEVTIKFQEQSQNKISLPASQFTVEFCPLPLNFFQNLQVPNALWDHSGSFHKWDLSGAVCIDHFSCNNSSKFHHKHFCSFFYRGNWGLKQLSNLPRVIYIVNDKAEIWMSKPVLLTTKINCPCGHLWHHQPLWWKCRSPCLKQQWTS